MYTIDKKNLKKNPIKCDCDKIQTTYHVAPSGCANDDAAVAALPDKWVPKHSGPTLANYLKKREQDHDKILQDIADSAKIINDRVDSKIRALAEALLAYIKHNNNKFGCVVQNYNMDGNVLDKILCDEALKEIYQLHSQRIEEMSHFKRESSALERERAESLRIVLRDQFQILISIGHFTPRDLLHDFDDRVYQVNQQLLSNTRAYVDLEAQLRVQADESVRRARSAINQLCLGKSTIDRAQSAVLRNPDDRSNHQRSPSAAGDKKNEISMLSVCSTTSEEAIDACIMRFVQAYKAAVMRVFNDFSAKLVNLEKDLGTNHYFTNLDSHSCQAIEFRNMIEKAVCGLSNTIHKKQIASREMLETTGADMSAMQKSLWSLGECLQNTVNVLHDAGHLWDNHILRQALAQKLTIAAVEDLLTSNDTIEMANEVAFNIALEHLRGSSDLDRLQVEYGNVIGMLDRTAEMYRLHSEAELMRLEEFMKLPTPLANCLLAKFQCFLDKYPRLAHSRASAPSTHDPNSSSKAPSEILLSPLPRAILQTELQELALGNWRNGFLESFECNVSLVPEELRRQARFWVEERANALHMRFSFKMVSHSIRVERVKVARETRHSELIHHEDRLVSHLDALHHLIEYLPKDALRFPETETTSLYPFHYWISSIQENMNALTQTADPPDPETKRLKMCSYAPRLLKHRKLYEESINTAVEEYRRTVENRIQNARISSVRLMTHIRLFSEGGEYSAHEATRASTALVKGAESLDTCVTKVMDALNNRRNYLLSQADQLLLPLQKICDEVLGTARVKVKAQKKK